MTAIRSASVYAWLAISSACAGQSMGGDGTEDGDDVPGSVQCGEPTDSEFPDFEPPPGDDAAWPMVAANPQRTSWTPESVTGQLQVKWYRPIEAYIPQNSQLIASHGLIYVTTARGLVALSADTGAVVWRFDTELPLGNSPTVAGDTLYVGGYDRALHALHAVTGEPLWTFTGAGAGFDTNPLVIGGAVFVGNRDGAMYAIGAHGGDRAGELLWRFATGGPIHLSAAYHDGVVYFASNDNHAYAVCADDGQLRWQSARLPGDGYHSYWPVIYRDKVILSAASGYRNGSPGTGSVDRREGGRGNGIKGMQLDGLFPAQEEGTIVGPQVEDRAWARGYPTIDASALTEYFEDDPGAAPFVHKPWRRTTIVLNLADGSEHTFDSDGDGSPEYAPIGFWGTGSGSGYPPVVGEAGDVLYHNNVHMCCSDAKGRVMGWNVDEPSLLAVLEGFGALAEPQALSAGGGVLYRNLCCDRVGDYFAIENVGRSGRGTVWSYDLGQRAPDYDPMWIDLPGWPRLHAWYRGKSATLNAAYHNHGDQNPLVPYRGTLFVHRSNTVLAFGAEPGPGALPAVDIACAEPETASLPRDELAGRLAAEVEAILDAGGYLRPGYYNVAQFMVRGFEDYFDNPGDTLSVLARAAPHLEPAVRERLISYLRGYFDEYFAGGEMIARIGWADGLPREAMPLPPEVEADLAGRQRAPNSRSFTWIYPPQNLYALWKYAELVPEDADRAYELARAALVVPVPAMASAELFGEKPYEHNAYLAGYVGFIALQELVGASGRDAELRAQVQAELDRLRQLKAELFTGQPFYGDDNFRYTKHFDLARNFEFLVPEVGAMMAEDLGDRVEQVLAELTYIAPYWFVARYEAVIGEGVMSNLYNYHALFQARAHIQGLTSAELSRTIDTPAFARGDLFYLDNLIAALTAP